MLYDMHCHLDFSDEGPSIARSMAGLVSAFSATVDPDRFDRAIDRLACAPQVRVGLGLHPWQASSPHFDDQVERFVARAAACPFVGEVGIDFSPRRLQTREAQMRAFDRVVRALVEGDSSFASGIVSIHAVHAADEAIDAFERCGATARSRFAQPASASGRALVLHSFAGTSDQLHRAIEAGFFFSVGSRMLAVKRGRAYVRAIPVERLLLETDMPAHEGDSFSADVWRDSLESSLAALAEARGDDVETLRAVLSATSARILGV